MKSNSNYFYADLKTTAFTNIAYRLSGFDPLLHQKHSHDGFEIMQIWCDNGYVLIDDQVYPMRNGAIYLVNGIESHSTNPTTTNDYVRSKITFSPSYIQAIAEAMALPRLLEPFTSQRTVFQKCINLENKDKDEIDLLFNNIQQEVVNEKTGFNASIASCLIRILIILNRYFTSNNGSYELNDYPSKSIINSITAYISKNLSTYKLADMCNSLHISKYYTCHLFKKITGMTIMEYVLDQKIAIAKRKLLQTGSPVSEIAMDLGFTNFSLFSRTFKRLTGLSPREYKNSHANHIK